MAVAELQRYMDNVRLAGATNFPTTVTTEQLHDAAPGKVMGGSNNMMGGSNNMMGGSNNMMGGSNNVMGGFNNVMGGSNRVLCV